jgi:uncharacterized membrane protein YiaA
MPETLENKFFSSQIRDVHRTKAMRLLSISIAVVSIWSAPIEAAEKLTLEKFLLEVTERNFDLNATRP